MKIRILLVVILFALTIPAYSIGESLSKPLNKTHKKVTLEESYWIRLWKKRDRSIYAANRVAARAFGVSESLLNTIVGREGGNIRPRFLRITLCNPYAHGGKGWNNYGSYAFGPYQFMMDSKPACFNSNRWGTFGSYDNEAFKKARRLGLNVPHRFMNPASNVGQAIVAAYMLSTPSTGGISHWCASMC